MSTKLNCGSGQRKFTGNGWINIDCQAKWQPDIVADASNLGMIADESAELVCLHHVLEHFGCGEGSGMLKECWRVLKPGGSLLVFVPDMKALCGDFAWPDKHRLSEQVFFTNVYGAYMGDEADRHKWGYTYSSLCDTINAAGSWKSVKRFDWREIEGADIAGPDWWILGCEAIK